ncbi:MAG: hypothetical protein Q7R48_02955, partial [bacterium]|nr:hypothetical protein [bacterium]
LQTGEIIYHGTNKQYVSKRFPNGKWVAEIRRVEKGRLKRYPRKAFATPQEALAYVVMTRPSPRGSASTVRRASEPTISNLYEEWRRHAWKNIANRTKAERERRWRLHIQPFWGGWTVSQVSRRAAQEWLTEAEDANEPKPAQLIEIRIDLHSMFKFAIRTEFADFERANPFEGLEAKTRPKRALVTIESQDFGPILHAADLLSREGFVTSHGLVVPWIVQMFAVSLLAGLRRGEVIALMHDRIDWDNGAIRVDRAMRREAQEIDERLGVPVGPILRFAVNLPKGDRIREVPLSDQLAAILSPLCQHRHAAEAQHAFLWPEAGGRMKDDSRVQRAFGNFRKWMSLLAKAAPNNGKELPDLPRSRWSRINAIVELLRCNPGNRIPDIFDRLDYRDSRNSFSSYLNELGIPQATHQQIMGHGPKDVTGTFYTRITSRAFQDARSRLSAGWEIPTDLK